MKNMKKEKKMRENGAQKFVKHIFGENHEMLVENLNSLAHGFQNLFYGGNKHHPQLWSPTSRYEYLNSKTQNISTSAVEPLLACHWAYSLQPI